MKIHILGGYRISGVEILLNFDKKNIFEFSKKFKKIRIQNFPLRLTGHPHKNFGMIIKIEVKNR